MKRCGLTLVEVMVVLGALLILMAILWPDGVYHIKDARKSACQANLKMIGWAFREYEREVGGFPRIHLTADPGGSLMPDGANALKDVSTNPMDQMWAVLGKDLLPPTAFHCPADEDWTERTTPSKFGWTADTEFSYGLQFPFDFNASGSVKNAACPAGEEFPPNGIVMADIGNDNHGGAAVTNVDHYTNHNDGLSVLTLAGNVFYHNPDTVNAGNGSVVMGNQIYDDDGTVADDWIPDAIEDIVILPLR